MSQDGRKATQPYRIRVGATWYWVDPSAPLEDLELGDTVVVYPAAGDAVLAILESEVDDPLPETVRLSSLEGEEFEVPGKDIATLHLAAVDEEQG